MWDRPDLLNRLADLLLTLAGLLAVSGALYLVVHLPVFALREIHVTGRLARVQYEHVQTLVARELKGNFLTLDLAATRAAFEKLQWARQVSLRRHWPGRLEVAVEEHVPLARWGSLGLVNTHGEVFVAAYEGELPMFVGPAESAKEITIQYEYFRRSLAAIGKVPVQVQLSPRRAWQVRLDAGPTLELGREQVEARLSRFVAAYGRTVGQLERRIDHVDLRYANGFAVRIPELRLVGPEPRGRRGGQGRERR